jgi:MarR family transcriptional regulator, 2-MHQ and catechol-resistance regulon repressor
LGTKYIGSDDQVRSLNSYIALLRCAETVTSYTARHLAAAKLTVGQFGVLETLYHLGPLCQRDIGRKLLRSGGNMTTVIDNLARRGLVERHPYPEDRRYWQVDLTAEGREVIAALFPRHLERITERLQVLDADEQEQLRRLCRKLGLADVRKDRASTA